MGMRVLTDDLIVRLRASAQFDIPVDPRELCREAADALERLQTNIDAGELSIKALVEATGRDLRRISDFKSLHHGMCRDCADWYKTATKEPR